MRFFCPFKHFDIFFGKEGAGLCASRSFVLLAIHTLICVPFSLPPGVWGCMQLLILSLPGLDNVSLRKLAVYFFWLLLPGDCRVTDEA